MDSIKKLAAAGALVGFLGVGGMTLASAQDSPTSTTTTPSTEAAPTPPKLDGGCPHMGGDSSGSPGSAPSTPTTPSTPSTSANAEAT